MILHGIRMPMSGDLYVGAGLIPAQAAYAEE